MDNNFGYEIDLSENISEQLKKGAMLEKRPKCGREGSHCEYSDYAASTPPLIENRCLDHLRLLDQFSYRKRNQYHSSSTIDILTLNHCKKIIKMSLKWHVDFMAGDL